MHRNTLVMLLVLLLPSLAVGADNQLSEEEQAAGFKLLFDGESLAGWQGSTKGYQVENGALVCKKEGGGFLYTDREYGDFVFRFDFKLTPGANNGVGLRTPIGGDPAYVGMESQILDDTAEGYKNLAPYQYHGSIYGVAPAVRGRQKPVGEWNTQEITCRGKRVTVKLNGYPIVDVNIADASNPRTMDGKAHPGLEREKGHLCFCGHGARVEFKNIKLREIPGSEAARAQVDVGCVVSDADRAMKFYTEVIGFTEQTGFVAPASLLKSAGLTDGAEDIKIRVCTLTDEVSATRLKLIQAAANKTKPSENQYVDSQIGFRYLTIFVKDMNVTMARLEKAGVKPLAAGPVALPESIAKGIYLAVVADPDGNMVELVGPKAE